MERRVIIAGGGFAGLETARTLERLLPAESNRLVLVNDVNFMLYTPLLPEAAGGSLEPRHVVTPLRDVLKRTQLRLGAVTGHDPATRTATVTGHHGEQEQFPYDQLLLAVGSVSRSLPIPGLSKHATGFKSLADAIWLRNHLIETLEAANATEDPALREELLSYVFVGGGYSGLEALAELEDFAADAIQAYPRARLSGIRFLLIDAADRVLPEIPRKLADYTTRVLRDRGIRIQLGTRLESVTADAVVLSSGERVPTRTVVWTAGVVAHPSMRSMGVELDEHGRVAVDDHLRVHGLDGVYAAGDCAAVPNPSGGLCPPTAQHAIRQARVAAQNMAAGLGVGHDAPFRYRDRGSFVNLGRHKAVASGLGLAVSGLPAWSAARTYHVRHMPGGLRHLHTVADWVLPPFERDTSLVGPTGPPRPLSAEEYERGGTHRPLR